MRQGRHRQRQLRIDLAGELGGVVARDVEEMPPVDRPIGRERPEPTEVRGDRRVVRIIDEDRHVLDVVVEVVLGSDLAVAEAVRADRELDRHERLVLHPIDRLRGGEAVDRLVLAVARGTPLGLEHGVDNVAADDPRQEVEGDCPLVMPADEALGLGEDVSRVMRAHRTGQVASPDVVDDLVVEVEERQLELTHDDVLVVALVADQCPTLLVPGQVACLERVAVGVRRRVLADEQLGRVVGVVDERLVGRARPIDRVEVEARSPEVGQRVGIVLVLKARRRVERQVVIEELADIGEARRDLGVVVSGCFVAAASVARAVSPCRLAHLQGEPIDQRGGRIELGQCAEHPSEPAENQL